VRRIRGSVLAGTVAGAMALIGAVLAPSAFADLPVGYDVQRVDSPNPTTGSDFGIGFTGAGDLNGDGKTDLIVGTDEHGGSIGTVYEMSGANGSLIRSITAPDASGDTGTNPSFGSYVGSIPDLGSCPGGTAGQTCPNATVGPPDGTPDLLVTALGQDVGFNDPQNSNNPATLVDAGRAYVIDGATGAILKRVQMPAVDLSEQLHAPGGAKKPAFGRTILNPSSQYGAANATPPAAVQIGDLDGGGKPDFMVGASDYFETGATANPDSPCAAAGPSAQCLQAGRAYVFRGEDIAGSNPSVILDNPYYEIKNPTAQPDDLNNPVNVNRESMGYSVAPVGDLGKCNTNPGPGAACTNASSTGNPDGLPDIALSSHRTDEFGMFDVGVVYLIDGANGSVLYTYHHPEPQPASIFGFTNYNQPAIGDVGSSTAPDVYEPAMRQNNPYTGGGKGYLMNGAFKQSGSPNAISFATLNDPTPHPSEDFGTSSAGIGNVEGGPANEILVGAYGPHNPGTNQDVINDVHVFDVAHEQSLQDIPAPDQQPGLGFGTALAPMGDLNGDGFQDFAVGAGLYDLTTSSGSCSAGCADAGRIYILRSNNQALRSLTLKASKHKVRKGRHVRLSGDITATGNLDQCVANQTVHLDRKRHRDYHQFDTAKSNSMGHYSDSLKIKRTYTFRARLRSTAACQAAKSAPVKVKVKRRRHR
jgi:hypothetical protein